MERRDRKMKREETLSDETARETLFGGKGAMGNTGKASEQTQSDGRTKEETLSDGRAR